MIITIFILGFLFGAILQYAKLNKYNTISGMATLDNLTVAKAIAVAIGIGALLLNIEISLGLASYHVKPMLVGGIVVGGLLFGTGMAILGYCPGTMAISLGEGSLDALIGIVGGLAGGLVYTIWLPLFKSILGPNLGSISLNSLLGANQMLFFLVLFIISGIFIGASFWLHKMDGTKDFKWLISGIGLAILNPIVFLTAFSNRPIGASTSYPYAIDMLTKTTENDYFTKITGPGRWELIFLAGAFISGLVLSLMRKDFKLRLIHENWKKYKGMVVFDRIIWAFVGGFILIFGARMAGGCTSGHILSGGMQLAASSLIFAAFVFAGLLITGKLFYKMGK
ncbi:MAG: transporter [Bacteroidetes bacterium CG18_big_fil_WC_8_21_14_2_50_41_14]|nr:MAG: transporter [Bacteroidetes bacterium CG18_big_fil_WC_8_21_14_2_50_41_14]PJB57524.1 MAG: transporter [Bacteroidetes bacterium CG_4_9_14_3_um_filter_41_19]